MKNAIFLILISITTLSSYSQNNAPIAVNDTFYVDYNDSLSIIQFSGSFLFSQPNSLNFLSNDTDPDGNLFYIDTAFYYGGGFFSIVTDSFNITAKKSSIGYKPTLNFVGLDSIQYIIEDNGIPIMYDTSTVYFFVKHQEFQQLDLNNISARLSLNSLFNDAVNGIAAFEVPKRINQNDPKYTTFYAANFWAAGKNQDSVYNNSMTFGVTPSSFLSRGGPIMDSMYYQQYDYTWDRLWKITSNAINYHINNWSNAGYQPIEVIKNWPAHGDVSKGQAYNLAPYYDNNNDNIYNPFDGDYPIIKGQQAVYFIYNDIRFSSNSGSRPLNSEVHYMAYAYNCPSDSAINNTIFIDYTIYNRSNLTYDSTYVGMWTDMDIGGSTDDAIGCDVARSTFYTYNGDAVDESANGSQGYQNYPPAQGVTFLQGAKQDNDGIDNNSGIAPYETINGLGFGDGITDNEYWGMEYFMLPNNSFPLTNLSFHNNLKGIWYDDTPLVWGGNGHVSGGGTIPTKHLSPGNTDPLWYGTGGIAATPSNWVGGSSGDVRGVGSTGPFTFEPDSSISITLAFVFGRDYQNTGNQAGVVVMQERIDSIQSYFATDFVSVCGGALSVNDMAEKENSLLVYPNPFNSELTIDYELENKEATLVIYNLIGKQIKTQTITKNTTIIDLASQPNGIYFITITDGENRMSRKVIKQ